MIITEYDVVILDMSNIFYRSYCAINYENDNGVDVSGIFGTLQTIQSLLRQLNPKCVVAVFDGKGGSKKKKKIYDKYKEGRSIPIKVSEFIRPEDFKKEREKSRENFLSQMRKLNEFLSYLPIYRIAIEGYEADELIAYVAQNYLKNNSIAIVSGDKDFQQLHTDIHHCYYLHTKTIVSEYELEQKWGSSYGKMITIARCFFGDASDNINGIYGFKLKTLQNYFPYLFDKAFKPETIDDVFKRMEEEYAIIKEKGKEYASNFKTLLAKHKYILEDDDKDSCIKCRDILKRNYTLMQLFEPDINMEAKMRLNNVFTQGVEFKPIDYKQSIIREGIQIIDKTMLAWELSYKDLDIYQKKFKEKFLLT